jgi:hypothetical protein
VVAQVFLILPTGALLMATGGDDLPVLALMGLSLVLLDTDRPVGSGMALGAAMALKQTAWFLLPFVVAASGRFARRTLVAALVVAVPVVTAFLMWDPAAFVEDVVRFPLGLGQGTSAAGTPTIGSVLVEVVPAPRGVVIGFLAALASGVGVWLLLRRPRPAAAAAARTAAWLAVAFALAPSARFGYLVYPLALVALAHLLKRPDGPGTVAGEAVEWPSGAT